MPFLFASRVQLLSGIALHGTAFYGSRRRPEPFILRRNAVGRVDDAAARAVARDFTRVSGFPRNRKPNPKVLCCAIPPWMETEQNNSHRRCTEDFRRFKVKQGAPRSIGQVKWWLLHCLEGSDLEASDVLMVLLYADTMAWGRGCTRLVPNCDD